MGSNPGYPLSILDLSWVLSYYIRLFMGSNPGYPLSILDLNYLSLLVGYFLTILACLWVRTGLPIVMAEDKIFFMQS